MNTKLFLNTPTGYQELDLYQDIDILLQYEETNIRNFESLKTEHSKTIILPGTPNNNNLLGQLYDITSSGTFNPLQKVDCYIQSDSLILFEGVFKLLSITNNPTGTVEYECVLIGKTTDFFEALKSLRLRDIDLSDFNHTLTKQNIINSWNYLIKYQNNDVPFELGFGYVYPLEMRGTQDYGYIWNPKDFSPAIYLKTLIDSGLSQLGYNYQSKFFNSEEFKRLIIPNVYQRIPLREDVLNNKNFEASRTNNSIGVIPAYSPTNNFINTYGLQGTKVCWIPQSVVNSQVSIFYPLDLFNQDVSDPGNHFNEGTGIIEYINQPIKGELSVDLHFDIAIKVYVNNAFGGNFVISSFPLNPNIGSSFPLDKDTKWIITYELLQNNAVIDTQEQTISVPVAYISMDQGNDVTKVIYSGYLNFKTQVTSGGIFAVRIYFKTGDYQAIMQDTGGSGVVWNGEAQLIIKSPDSRLKFKTTDIYAEENDPVDLSLIMDDKATLYDIFKDIGRMFNLRYTFINDDKTIIIEPAHTYYSEGVVKDWSKKIDYNQPIKIETISDLDYNKIKFHYIEDGDHYNKYTLSQYKRYYGEQLITFDNDFGNEERVIKTETIASTPNVNWIGDICLPVYCTYEGGNYKPISKIKPRILIYGGLVNTLSPSTFWVFISKGEPFDIINNIRYQYPFAGHINHPYNPSWDINFGIGPSYYWNYTLGQLTDNNLYNRFYKQLIESEINPDTKILTAYFYLTNEDIFKFRYNDKIFISNSYYRVNKIIDFNPINPGLTKVELIKLIDADGFIPKINTINSNNWIDNDLIKDNKQDNISIPLEDISQPSSGYQQALRQNNVGSNNYISDTAKNITINGDNNRISNLTSNINVQGDNNFIAERVSNVLVIGNNYSVYESNITIIEGLGIIKNGTLIPEYNLIDGGKDELQYPFSNNTINLIDGGKDNIRNLGSETPINLIDGDI